MNKTMKCLLTSAVSAFILITAPKAAAFIGETPSNGVTLAGTYTGAYAHVRTAIKIGASEHSIPAEINVTLTPDGEKAKLDLTCNGWGATTYALFTAGIVPPKVFPLTLATTEGNALQIDDATLPADSRGKLRIFTNYQGYPITFTLLLNRLTKVAEGAPQLSLTGNGHASFPITSLGLQSGALVAKGPAAAQIFPLPRLDLSAVVKTDLIEFLRQLLSMVPSPIATVAVDSKTDPSGKETKFTVTIKE
jgi:hypothetical protein